MIAVAAAGIAVFAVGLRIARAARGEVLATTRIKPGEPFQLEVPASATPRALWLRFKLTMKLPPTRGPKVYEYDHHGVVATVEIAGITTRYSRGKLVPEDVPAFAGGIGYDERVEGPLERREYTSTRKICAIEGAEALSISGSIEVAPANTLLEATVWATGPVSQR